MSTSAPTLALYRARVPAHAGVSDAVVEVFLTAAIEAHTASGWGDRYDIAMSYWAAHHIERTPGLVPGRKGSALEVGAVTSLTDSQSVNGRSSNLSKSLTNRAGKNAEEAEYLTTRYGSLYLTTRASRALDAPFVVGP